MGDDTSPSRGRIRSGTGGTSKAAGDIEQRLNSRNVEATTDSVINVIDEEQEVLAVMKSFKAAMKTSSVKGIKMFHLEMVERLEVLEDQREAVRIDLEGVERSEEPIPEDLSIIQNLRLLDRNTSLARTAERLTTAANKILTTHGSRLVAMSNTHKYLPSTTSREELSGTQKKEPHGRNVEEPDVIILEELPATTTDEPSVIAIEEASVATMEEPPTQEESFITQKEEPHGKAMKEPSVTILKDNQEKERTRSVIYRLYEFKTLEDLENSVKNGKRLSRKELEEEQQ